MSPQLGLLTPVMASRKLNFSILVRVTLNYYFSLSLLYVTNNRSLKSYTGLFAFLTPNKVSKDTRCNMPQPSHITVIIFIISIPNQFPWNLLYIAHRLFSIVGSFRSYLGPRRQTGVKISSWHRIFGLDNYRNPDRRQVEMTCRIVVP